MLFIAIVLVLLALLVHLSGLPELDTDETDEAVGAANVHKTSIFQFPHLLLGVVTLFLYVGVEVIAADSIINYGPSQGIPLSTAKFFTSCTLGCMLGWLCDWYHSYPQIYFAGKSAYHIGGDGPCVCKRSIVNQQLCFGCFLSPCLAWPIPWCGLLSGLWPLTAWANLQKRDLPC